MGIDFLWLIYIGHTLLGYTEHEVGRMTLKKLLTLYGFYKNHYDFKLSHIKYSELEDAERNRGDWFPDDD